MYWKIKIHTIFNLLNSNVINGSIANITDLNAGNISTTNKVEAREIYSDTVTSDVVEANTANITEISADTITTNNLTIKDTITVDVDSDTVSADYLSANNAHISTIESDNVDTTNVFASNGNIQNLTLGISNITSAEIQNTNIINANVYEETVNKSNITLANVQNANIDIMQNRFKAHDKYFIDIPQPAGGNTDYKIIKLNPFINGTYRLTYVGLDGETLFSVIFTQAFDNISFKYTKNAEYAKRPAFEKVAIYNDYIYIQTFFGGRLYYQCDALNAEQQPSTYDEWPIDLLDEDCYVYEAARVYGDVYTHYVIAENMKDGGGVNKLLNVSAVDNIENINPKYGEEPLHYDGQEEINLNIYIPDQVLNTDSDVEFNKVTTKDLATTGSVTHFNDVITLRMVKKHQLQICQVLLLRTMMVITQTEHLVLIKMVTLMLLHRKYQLLNRLIILLFHLWTVQNGAIQMQLTIKKMLVLMVLLQKLLVMKKATT